MPSISAASRSAATARICLPSLVLLTSSRSPTISAAPVTSTMICTESMVTGADADPAGQRDEVRRVIDPVCPPNSSRTEFSRKNEMPIAVIRGAIRGASRSGR